MLKNYKFFCDGILVSFFGIIGVIGNITSIIVLSRPNFSDTFHKLLVSLAAFDTAYIIFGGINYTFRAFEVGSTNAYQIAFVYVIHPFTSITMCGTTFMTVAISIERFLGELNFAFRVPSSSIKILCRYLLSSLLSSSHQKVLVLCPSRHHSHLPLQHSKVPRGEACLG